MRSEHMRRQLEKFQSSQTASSTNAAATPEQVARASHSLTRPKDDVSNVEDSQPVNASTGKSRTMFDADSHEGGLILVPCMYT